MDLLRFVEIFPIVVSAPAAISLGKPGSPWARRFYDPEHGSGQVR